MGSVLYLHILYPLLQRVCSKEYAEIKEGNTL